VHRACELLDLLVNSKHLFGLHTLSSFKLNQKGEGTNLLDKRLSVHLYKFTIL
jgi:hypothetical protein